MNIVANQGPGRPKSQAKRDAIRHAAAHLFLCEGLHKTSMDAVAAAAKVSKQTVYSHFRCKEDLFRACISSKLEDYGLDETSLAQDTPVADFLSHVGRHFLDLLCDPQAIAMFRLIIAEGVAHPELAQTFMETGPMVTKKIVAAHLERECANGSLRIDDIADAAGFFLDLIKGRYFLELQINARSDVSDEERQQHVEKSVQRFLTLYAA